MGVDPVEDNVRIAKLHSSSDPTLRGRLQYRACTIEELPSEETEAFDAIVASELVEHLLDVDVFIQCSHQVLKVSQNVAEACMHTSSLLKPWSLSELVVSSLCVEISLLLALTVRLVMQLEVYF